MLHVDGDLTIHDVTNKVSVKGTIEVVSGGINANSKFNVVPEDYKITIPGVVRDKIDKTLEVTVAMKYSPSGRQVVNPHLFSYILTMKPYIKISLFVVFFIALFGILYGLMIFFRQHSDLSKVKPDYIVTAVYLTKRI